MLCFVFVPVAMKWIVPFSLHALKTIRHFQSALRSADRTATPHQMRTDRISLPRALCVLHFPACSGSRLYDGRFTRMLVVYYPPPKHTHQLIYRLQIQPPPPKKKDNRLINALFELIFDKANTRYKFHSNNLLIATSL